MSVCPDPEGVGTFAALDILDPDIPYHRWKRAGIPFFIEEIDLDDSVSEFSYLHIPHENILDEAAPDRVGLDPQGAVKVGTVHRTAFRIDVPDAPRHLTPDHHPAMPVFHLAILDDNIFG